MTTSSEPDRCPAILATFSSHTSVSAHRSLTPQVTESPQIIGENHVNGSPQAVPMVCPKEVVPSRALLVVDHEQLGGAGVQ